MSKFNQNRNQPKHISKKRSGKDLNFAGQLTPGAVTEDKLADNSVAEDKLESRVKARVLDINPTDLRIGLDFESKMTKDPAAGGGKYGPEPSMWVAGTMIRQGAIMNITRSDNTSFWGRNWTGAAAKAVNPTSKFGEWAAYTPSVAMYSGGVPGGILEEGSHGGFGFPAHTKNPYKNTLTCWYQNVASGDSIAFNPAMGINIFVDTDGKLKVRVETLLPNGNNAKTIYTASTDSTDHIGTSEYRNVIIQWQFNEGASDFISIKINGVDDGTPVTGSVISVDCPNGGNWLFQCSPNDPVWTDELSFLVAPDTEGTWTRQLNGTPTIATLGDGDMNVLVDASPGQRVWWTKTTPVIDLNDFTLDYSLLVTTGGPKERLDADKIMINLGDNVRTGPDTSARSVIIQHWRDTLSIFVGERGSTLMHVYSQPIQTETKHYYRFTSYNDPDDPNYGDPICIFYVDGIPVVKFNNSLVSTPGSDFIYFGTDITAIERNLNYTWGHFRYANGAIAGNNGGTISRKNSVGQLLDSVGLIEGNITNDVVALLQDTPVTEVYRRRPTYMPYLREMKRSQLGTNTTVASTTFDEPNSFGSADGRFLYGDGETEYELTWEADTLAGTAGRTYYPALAEVDSNYTVVGETTIGPDMRWVTMDNHQASKRDKFVVKRRMIISAGDRVQFTPAIMDASGGGNIDIIRDSWWLNVEIVGNKGGTEE